MKGTIEERLREQFGNDEEILGTIVILKNPDYEDAIVGISQDHRLIYDYNLMVKSLMKEDNMTEEDAIDFIEYNTIRALPYMGIPPIIMHEILE